MILNSDIHGLPGRLPWDVLNNKPVSPDREGAEEAGKDRVERSHLSGLLEGLPQAAHHALQRVMQSGADVNLLLDRIDRPDAMDALDAALDLTPGRAGDLLATLSRMTPQEADAALKALAELLKRGIIGYEYRKVNGEPIDPRWMGAVFRKDKTFVADGYETTGSHGRPVRVWRLRG